MSFTSITFAGFFLTVLALYWVARQKTRQNIILLIASYIFYGWANPWYAILLGLSTGTDFLIALGMSRSRAGSRLLLVLSLVLNLGVLAFFKYHDFFNVSLTAQLAQIGIHTDLFLVSIILPAGLSFYTLKKVAYMVDVSRGTFPAVRNFIDFSLYVSFFPQIVAGPIDRPQTLLPQIESSRTWNWDFFSSAWPLVVMGLFQKIVVADTVKSIVDRVFSMSEPSRLLVLLGALGFTLQILADFSAYTNISRGVAWMFGFETSKNFNTPYLALTPSDFWNRWHITLSNFLRDYIFFPLRRALLKQRTLSPWLAQVIPPLVTMSVSGLWHGAGWTYLAWGIYYGLLIVIYESSGLHANWRPGSRIKLFAAWLLMFSLTVFGWLLFRAPSLDWVGRVVFNAVWLTSPEDLAIGLVLLSILVVYSFPLILKSLIDRFTSQDSWWQAAYFTLITIAVVIYTNSSNSDFIYFQF